jgi:chromosome segregation ATPase
VIPLAVKARGRAELAVDERRGFPQGVDWLSELAGEAVQAYLGDTRADPKLAAELRAAWTLREGWRASNDEVRALEEEEQQLDKSARETRLSLQAIEKNTQAADLRVRLTKRLAELSARQEEVSKRLVERRMTRSEQEVRFREAIRELEILDPPPPREGA